MLKEFAMDYIMDINLNQDLDMSMEAIVTEAEALYQHLQNAISAYMQEEFDGA